MKREGNMARNLRAGAKKFFSAMVMGICVILSVADAVAETHSKTNEAGHADNIEKRRKCLGLSTSDESYRQAATRLVSTNLVKNWMAGLGTKQLAFGNNVDKTKFILGRCYWQISVYESDDERMQLWNIFRLDIHGREIYLVNQNGTAVSLSHEKKEAKGN